MEGETHVPHWGGNAPRPSIKYAAMQLDRMALRLLPACRACHMTNGGTTVHRRLSHDGGRDEQTEGQGGDARRSRLFTAT
jgi:hypothetical protein